MSPVAPAMATRATAPLWPLRRVAGSRGGCGERSPAGGPHQGRRPEGDPPRRRGRRTDQMGPRTGQSIAGQHCPTPCGFPCKPHGWPEEVATAGCLHGLAPRPRCRARRNRGCARCPPCSGFPDGRRQTNHRGPGRPTGGGTPDRRDWPRKRGLGPRGVSAPRPRGTAARNPRSTGPNHSTSRGRLRGPSSPRPRTRSVRPPLLSRPRNARKSPIGPRVTVRLVRRRCPFPGPQRARGPLHRKARPQNFPGAPRRNRCPHRHPPG